MTRPAIVLALIVALTFAARSFLPAEAHLTGSGAALAFGFLLLSAIQVGAIFHVLHLPHLTGFILCGAIFGPELLGLLTPAMVTDLALVKRVAVGLIALTAGCELNFRTLRPKLRSIGVISAATLSLSLVLLWGFLFVAIGFLPFTEGMTTGQRAIVALVGANALIALSPAVVMGIISETHAAGPLAELALSIVVVADLAVVITFTLTDSLVGAVFPDLGSGGGVGSLATHLLGSLVVGGAIGAGMAVYIRRVGKRVALFIFALMFVVAEAGGAIHLDPLLTGLAAGLFLENLSPVGGHRVVRELEPAAMPTFAVFFAVVGAEVHIHAFVAVAGYAIAAAATRAVGISAGAALASRALRLDPPLGRRIKFGLFPQAGIAIALANLVKAKFGAWGEALATLLLGTIVVNEMIGPVLWRIALDRAGEVGKKAHVEHKAHARADTTRPLDVAAFVTADGEVRPGGGEPGRH